MIHRILPTITKHSKSSEAIAVEIGAPYSHVGSFLWTYAAHGVVGYNIVGDGLQWYATGKAPR